MDNLPPKLTDRQLKANIDNFIKGGLPKEQIQSFVNNYQRDSMGGFTLKGQMAEQPVEGAPAPVANDDVNYGEGAEAFSQSLDKTVGGRTVKAVGLGLTKSPRAFGRTIAAGIAYGTGKNNPEGSIAKETYDAIQNLDASTQSLVNSQFKVLKAIQKAKAEGKDYSKLVSTYNASAEQLNNTPGAADIMPALEKSAKQVIGEAVGIGVDVLSAGALPGVGKAATTARTFGQGVKAGAKVGAIYGGAVGVGQGTASGLQEDKSAEDIIKQAGKEGIFGTVLGGILGGITGGVSGAMKGRADKKLLESEKLKGTIFDPDNIDLAKRELSDADSLPIERMIKNGEATPEQFYKNGKILADDYATTRIQDAAGKLDDRFPDTGLGDELMKSIDPANTTQEEIIKKANELVDDFSKTTKDTTKALKAVTPNANDFTPTEYEELLAKGKINPKTAKNPASYILSDKEKAMAYKYRELLQSADPVQNNIDIIEEIVRQDDEVGKFLRENNGIFNTGELKNSLAERLQDISDVTVAPSRIEKLKKQIIDNFVDGLEKKDMESLWMARKAFDRKIESAFSGSPTLQNEIKREFRNAVQDFIAEKTPDEVYKGAMREMSGLFDLKDTIARKAVKEKGKNAIMLWIKHNPVKAKLIGWGGGLTGAGVAGSVIIGE